MNDATTKLFIEYLQNRSTVREAIADWMQKMDDDESSDATIDATVRYMATIHQELMGFIGTIDVGKAALAVQEEC